MYLLQLVLSAMLIHPDGSISQNLKNGQIIKGVIRHEAAIEKKRLL